MDNGGFDYSLGAILTFAAGFLVFVAVLVVPGWTAEWAERQWGRKDED